MLNRIPPLTQKLFENSLNGVETARRAKPRHNPLWVSRPIATHRNQTSETVKAPSVKIWLERWEITGRELHVLDFWVRSQFRRKFPVGTVLPQFSQLPLNAFPDHEIGFGAMKRFVGGRFASYAPQFWREFIFRVNLQRTLTQWRINMGVRDAYRVLQNAEAALPRAQAGIVQNLERLGLPDPVKMFFTQTSMASLKQLQPLPGLLKTIGFMTALKKISLENKGSVLNIVQEILTLADLWKEIEEHLNQLKTWLRNKEIYEVANYRRQAFLDLPLLKKLDVLADLSEEPSKKSPMTPSWTEFKQLRDRIQAKLGSWSERDREKVRDFATQIARKFSAEVSQIQRITGACLPEFLDLSRDNQTLVFDRLTTVLAEMEGLKGLNEDLEAARGNLIDQEDYLFTLLAEAKRDADFMVQTQNTEVLLRITHAVSPPPPLPSEDEAYEAALADLARQLPARS